MSSTKRFSPAVYLIGIVAILVLTAIPLVIIQDSEFGGADGVGSEIVAEIAPEYNAEWATNIWEPPGGETESMLFAVQATFGGVLIGYCFGFFRGRNSKEK